MRGFFIQCKTQGFLSLSRCATVPSSERAMGAGDYFSRFRVLIPDRFYSCSSGGGGGQQMLCFFAQNRARFCQGDEAIIPLDKAYAKLLLQRRDRTADRGMADIHPPRRAREAPFIRDGREHAQLLQLHQ